MERKNPKNAFSLCSADLRWLLLPPPPPLFPSIPFAAAAAVAPAGTNGCVTSALLLWECCSRYALIIELMRSDDEKRQVLGDVGVVTRPLANFPRLSGNAPRH